jgi:hypothetical protein
VGLAAAAAGEIEEASRLLADARAANARMLARPWLAWTERDLAIVLERAGKGALSLGLRRSALAHARALGMIPLVEELSNAPSAPGPEPPPVSSAILRRANRGWELTLGERTGRLPDRRGLAYLATLLASPGEEVHVLSLTSGGAEAPREAAGEALLDARAKAELRARVATLRIALADAEEAGDRGRALAARRDLEALEDHLAAALGLGGRSRAHGSAAERARMAVTVAIRRAIATIEPDFPEIAAHLARSIRTGLFCAYDPDPATSVRVTT